MKTSGVLLLVLTWTSVAHAAYDLGAPGGATPYDRSMAPVRALLGRLPKQNADPARVRAWIKTARGYRYSFTDPVNPQLPEVTERLHSGDCKAKSFWLADRMRDGSVRFVIGKLRANSRINHAWLVWRDGPTLYILDPTIKSDVVAADTCGPSNWVPLYSYEQGRIYRHAAIARYGENWEHPTPIANFPALTSSRLQRAAVPRPPFPPSIRSYR